MPVEVILPKVDMDMTHGTIAVWHVPDGAAVSKGAPLFDIETDKAAMEVEAPATGRLHHVTARAGDTVAVGGVVAWIYVAGEMVGPPPCGPLSPAEQATPLAPAGGGGAGQDADAAGGGGAGRETGAADGTGAPGGTGAAGALGAAGEATAAGRTDPANATGAAGGLFAPSGAGAAGGTVPPGGVAAPGGAGAAGGTVLPAGVAEQGGTGAAQGAAPGVAAASGAASPAPVPDPGGTAAPTGASATTGLRATPAARAAARSAGLDLSDLTGTGPLGRRQRGDVLRHIDNLPAPPATSGDHWQPEPGPLHVSRRAGAGTTLVLLHGFTADSQSWAPLEKALGPANPLIRIDLPCHGRSPRRRIAGFAELARMLVEAFDTATRDLGPVHLIGHSLGAALALAIADIRPRGLSGLTLIAPAGLGPEVDAAALCGIARARRSESLAPWLRRLTATPDAISDDYARAAMRLRADPALRASQSDLADVLFPDGVQAFDLRPALSRLDLPAQILWGRRDHILPFRHALAADGDFGIHLMAGAGHVPQIECPDRVARIIARMIAPAGPPEGAAAQ